MNVINIAKDFSDTPGARYRSDGPFSGQEFREKYLEKLLENKSSDEKIKVILDGTAGYATSFLEETFGGLARKYGKEYCLRRLEFISHEDPLLIEDITSYINEA